MQRILNSWFQKYQKQRQGFSLFLNNSIHVTEQNLNTTKGKSSILDGEAIGRVFCWDNVDFCGIWPNSFYARHTPWMVPALIQGKILAPQRPTRGYRLPAEWWPKVIFSLILAITYTLQINSGLAVNAVRMFMNICSRSLFANIVQN